MPRRTRYQQGSVQREKRQSGSDVWVFRWWEATADGGTKRRKAIVGTVQALPTEASALKAAKALRIDANQQTPHSEGGPGTIAELVSHYRLKELVGENQGRKSFSTRAGYESYLNGWILPRWKNHRLDQVRSVAVEEWLDGIERFAEQDEDEFLSVDPKRKSKERAAGSEKTIGRQVRRACCGEAG